VIYFEIKFSFIKLFINPLAGLGQLVEHTDSTEGFGVRVPLVVTDQRQQGWDHAAVLPDTGGSRA
jgi:uncharacterized protein YceK